MIPWKADENRDSRPVAFDREAYRERNTVERLMGRRTESRRLFSGLKQTAEHFGGTIKTAFTHRYLRMATDIEFRDKA